MVFLIFNFHDESHRRGTDRSRGGIWNIGPQNRQTLVNPLNPYFGTLIKFTSHPIFTSSDSTSRKKIHRRDFLADSIRVDAWILFPKRFYGRPSRVVALLRKTSLEWILAQPCIASSSTGGQRRL